MRQQSATYACIPHQPPCCPVPGAIPNATASDCQAESPNNEFHDAVKEVTDDPDKYIPASPLAGMVAGPTTPINDSNAFGILQDWDKISDKF